MATYTNLRSVDVYVTDEFGLPTKFTSGETKTGQSAYFDRYTTGTDPVLTRTTSETFPAVIPAVRNENMVFLPGSTVGSTKEWSTDSAYNTTTAKRLKRVIFDPTTDTETRQIKTDYLGFRIVNTAVAATDDYGVYVDTTGDAIYFVVEDSDGAAKCYSIALTPVV